MQIVIRDTISLVSVGFEIRYCHTNIAGGVSAGFLFNRIDYRLYASAGIVYIVDNEQSIISADFFYQIVHAENLNSAGFLINCMVGRSSDRYVIRVYAAIGQQFLHRNPHRCAAAPNRDNKTGPESTAIDTRCQLKGVFQKLLGIQKFFLSQDCFPGTVLVNSLPV